MGSPGTAARVVVERLDVLYRLPVEHPDPAAARLRLDRLAASELPRRLASGIERALDPADPSLWLIRRLDVDLTCDLAAVDDAALAGAWAGELGRALARTLARGPDGEAVMRFADRPAFLARFLIDLAAGRAWGRWWYAELESLRTLPLAAALREALLREPAEIPAVLARLVEQGELATLLRRLSDESAGRLVAAAISREAGGADSRLAAELAALWPPGAGIPPGGSGLAALRLLALVAAGRPELLAEPGLAGTIELVVALATLLDGAPAPHELLRSLGAGDLVGAASGLRRAGLAGLLPLLPRLAEIAGGDPGSVERLTSALAARLPARGATASGTEEIAGATGVFFLLPSWLALDLEGWLDAVEERLDGPSLSRPELRRPILAKVFGRRRAAAMMGDAAVRRAAGSAGSTGPGIESCAALSALPGLGSALAAALAGHLARQGRAEGRTLALSRVEAPGLPPCRLLADIASGHWLGLAPARRRGAGRWLAAALDGLAAAGAAPADAVLAEGAFPTDWPGASTPRRVWAGRPRTRRAVAVEGAGAADLWSLSSEPLAEPALAELSRFLARRRPVATELEHLTLGRSVDLGPNPDLDLTLDLELDLATALAAHALLCHLGGRLMGFAGAGAEHLVTNFLAGSGEVHAPGEGLRVVLPATPLAVVARMAGADGMRYTAPWLGAVELALPAG